MISANDTTILAVLSRFPDMPAEEADGYISRIEHEENVDICHAVIGRIDDSALSEDARQTFREFQRWATHRTRNTRGEQWSARRRVAETRLALNLNRMHQLGLIPNETLIMYGISGPLPDRAAYSVMTQEEKEAIWRERMERRFGPYWQERATQLGFVTTRPVFDSRTMVEDSKVNWIREGF